MRIIRRPGARAVWFWIQICLIVVFAVVVYQQITFHDVLVVQPAGGGSGVEIPGTIEEAAGGQRRFYLDQGAVCVLPKQGEQGTMVGTTGQPVVRCANGTRIPLPEERFGASAAVSLQVRPGLITILRHLAFFPVLLAGLLFVLMSVLVTFRWRLLLKAQAISLAFWRGLQLTYIGYFCGTFLPGAVGGDVVKAWLVGNEHGKTPTVMMTALVDRALGFATLAFMVGLFIWLDWPTFSSVAMPLFAIVACLILGIAAYQRVLPVPSWVRMGLDRLPFQRMIHEVGYAFWRYRSCPTVVAQAMGLSFLIQLALVMIFILCGSAIGINGVPFSSFLIATPLIAMAIAVPLTPQGWGTAELISIYIWGLAGIAPTEAAMLPLLFRLLMLGWSLLGGLFLIRTPLNVSFLGKSSLE